ncbi:MAG TPA: adenylate/guanylate cyclase domain-containing protein [Microvirga sp.]|nr:adenylate/guanylate cyclase domain-containing protein [Microvirga sp.]
MAEERALGGTAAEARQAIREAERAGFRLLLIGRSILLAIAVSGFLYGYYLFGNPFGVLTSLASLSVGLAMLRAHGTRHERPWHPFVLVAVDVATLALAALYLPLTTGGEVPRIFVFRAYGIQFLWLILVISALALSPRLILFAGASAVAALWTVFAVAVRQLPETLSWGDLPVSSSTAEYMALLLDPRFIGTGNRVEESISLLAAALVLATVVARARRVVVAYAEEERRRRHVENVFGRYVPAEVAQALIDAPDALEPTERDGTVLFLDVEGFTAYAAERPPGEVLAALGDFLKAVTARVVEHGGVVIGFGGDSVLATFGLPLAHADHARRAFDAACRILDDAAVGQAGFAVRIGVATGPIAAGAVGGADRQSYTVYGRTVNLAQRLEEANKAFGTRLLACSRTVRESGCGRGEAFGRMTARGLPEPVEVYGVRISAAA